MPEVPSQATQTATQERERRERRDASGSAQQDCLKARQFAGAVLYYLTRMRLQIQKLQRILNQVVAGKVTFLVVAPFIDRRMREFDALLCEAQSYNDALDAVLEAVEVRVRMPGPTINAAARSGASFAACVARAAAKASPCATS